MRVGNRIARRERKRRISTWMVVPLFACLLVAPPRPLAAQSSISSTSMRPFVVGLVPVVGRRGAVGGVLIDASGVVVRSDAETLGRLREARTRALQPIAADLQAVSPMRKISLRGIGAALERLRREGRPVTEDLQNLAGVQRVEYVFVYSEQQDIVLAGYAEGWTIDAQGNVVGRTTGRPVVQLDDLLVALRTAENAAAGDGISCSIDPTPEGMRRLQKALRTRGLSPDDSVAELFEQALGEQQITVTGVPRGSHFACVLVAADIMLKRLGMNLEPAPIGELPGYLEMLQASTAPVPRNGMPRFWLAPHYDAVLTDGAGQAWQLRGSGVQVLAEDGLIGAGGTRVASATKEKHSLAVQWAERMTAEYPKLSAAMPVFQQLRNCIDLAVVGALFVNEELPRKANCDLSSLYDADRFPVAEHHVPAKLASHASLMRKGRSWFVAISGGVAVDSWPVLNRVEVAESLGSVRHKAASAAGDRWWWD